MNILFQPIKRRLSKHIHATTILVGSFALVILAGLSHPAEAPLWVVFLPFACLFLIIFCSCELLLRMFVDSSRARLRLMALTVSSVVTILLLLSSIHQLSFLDVVVATIFVAGGLFYVQNSRFYLNDNF